MKTEVAAGGYTRTTIARNDKFEIISCGWKEGHGSSPHSHGKSECWVLIESGRFENVSEWAGLQRREIFSESQVVSTPIGVVHSMRCLSGEGRTLHVYSPPLSMPEKRDSTSSINATEIALGEAGVSWSALESLAQKISRSSLPTDSPSFMNQLFSGLHPEALLASRLAAETRTTLATLESSPVLSRIESEVVQVLGAQIGWLPEDRGGVAVPGGSMANFMALHLARHRKFPESKEGGNPNHSRFAVFVSDQAHYSIKKACSVLGFGVSAICLIETDARGRIRPDALERSISASLAEGRIPLAVIATAGTTVFGAFDPLPEIASICRDHGIWLHVDAAWGGPALFSEKLKPQIMGIDQADSVTFDAHKLLGATLVSSYLLTRHPRLLFEANDVQGAEYLFHGDLDLGRLSWQCGRGADALGLWMIWKSRGTAGISALTDRLLGVRESLLPWIAQMPRLKWIAHPEYLNLCLQILPPAGFEDHAKEWSIRVRSRLKAEERAWINYSRTQEGVSFLRLILVHPALEVSHVQGILEAALEVVD